MSLALGKFISALAESVARYSGMKVPPLNCNKCCMSSSVNLSNLLIDICKICEDFKCRGFSMSVYIKNIISRSMYFWKLPMFARIRMKLLFRSSQRTSEVWNKITIYPDSGCHYRWMMLMDYEEILTWDKFFSLNLALRSIAFYIINSFSHWNVESALSNEEWVNIHVFCPSRK